MFFHINLVPLWSTQLTWPRIKKITDIKTEPEDLQDLVNSPGCDPKSFKLFTTYKILHGKILMSEVYWALPGTKEKHLMEAYKSKKYFCILDKRQQLLQFYYSPYCERQMCALYNIIFTLNVCFAIITT